MKIRETPQPNYINFSCSSAFQCTFFYQGRPLHFFSLRNNAEIILKHEVGSNMVVHTFPNNQLKVSI